MCTRSPELLIQARFFCFASGMNTWLTGPRTLEDSFSPPQQQLHQGFNQHAMAPPPSSKPLSHGGVSFFPNTSILFSFHLPRRSAAHRIPCCCPPQVPPPACPSVSSPTRSVFNICHSAQVCRRGGKRQIDVVNKPDKFSAPNRADLSVRGSPLFSGSVGNMTPQEEEEEEGARAMRLNDGADRCRSRSCSGANARGGEQKYIHFNSEVPHKCHRGTPQGDKMLRRRECWGGGGGTGRREQHGEGEGGATVVFTSG